MSFKPLFRRPPALPVLSQSGNPLFDGRLDCLLKLRFDSELHDALQEQAAVVGLKPAVFIRLVLRIKAFGTQHTMEKCQARLASASLDFGDDRPPYAPLFKEAPAATRRALRPDSYLDMELKFHFESAVQDELKRQAAAAGLTYHAFIRMVLYQKVVGPSHAASFIAEQVRVVGINVVANADTNVG